jgi:thiol-disulfide isomerase/thioredoxin
MSRLPRSVVPGAFAALLAIAAATHLAAAAPAARAAKPAPRTSGAHTPSAAAATPQRAAAPRADIAAGSPDITPAADSLLNAVNAHYLGLSSYDIEGTSHMLMSIGSQDQRIDVPFRLAMSKPARLRNEIMNPMMPYVNLSDGARSWVYLPTTQQYTEKEAAPLTSNGTSSGEIGNAMAMGTPLQRYLSANQGLVSARVVGEEAVDVAGTPVRCVVVDAQYATPDSARFTLSPNRFWIDRDRRLVVRDSLRVGMRGPDGSPVFMATVTTFSKFDIDRELPDTLFTFHPPAGAKLVAAFDTPGMSEPVSPMLGKPAEDFSLLDLAGKRQKLSALKGKVVLLDFWATWCGPCRRELPTIAKLHRELAAKGLAVVAVNVGEPAATVNAYLKKNQFSIPVWLDSKTEVSTRYQASSIPTLVVIDRAGKVTGYKVGVRDEAALRALLAEAGLK